MNAYEEMCEEVKQLKKKLSSLSLYLNAINFETTDVEHHGRLLAQRLFMSKYLEILTIRLELWRQPGNFQRKFTCGIASLTTEKNWTGTPRPYVKVAVYKNMLGTNLKDAIKHVVQTEGVSNSGSTPPGEFLHCIGVMDIQDDYPYFEYLTRDEDEDEVLAYFVFMEDGHEPLPV